MTDIDDIEDEKPLDPAMERVRRKLARLMVVSIGIMLVGLMAVLGAVVYKSSGSGDTQLVAEAVIDIPDGFAVADTAISETRLLFYGTDQDGTSLVLIFDARTGAKIGEHRVE